MIIPPCCFSCGFPISHLYQKYLELVKYYTENPVENKTPEFMALADLKIGLECCRRMFIYQHDMYKLIH